MAGDTSDVAELSRMDSQEQHSSKPAVKETLAQRLDRLAPIILWPAAAYTGVFRPHGSFFGQFVETKTNTVRLHGAQGLVSSPSKQGPKGLSLSFKRNRNKEQEPATAEAEADVAADQAPQAGAEGSEQPTSDAMPGAISQAAVESSTVCPSPSDPSVDGSSPADQPQLTGGQSAEAAQAPDQAPSSIPASQPACATVSASVSPLLRPTGLDLAPAKPQEETQADALTSALQSQEPASNGTQAAVKAEQQPHQTQPALPVVQEAQPAEPAVPVSRPAASGGAAPLQRQPSGSSQGQPIKDQANHAGNSHEKAGHGRDTAAQGQDMQAQVKHESTSQGKAAPDPASKDRNAAATSGLQKRPSGDSQGQGSQGHAARSSRGQGQVLQRRNSHSSQSHNSQGNTSQGRIGQDAVSQGTGKRSREEWNSSTKIEQAPSAARLNPAGPSHRLPPRVGTALGPQPSMEAGELGQRQAGIAGASLRLESGQLPDDARVAALRAPTCRLESGQLPDDAMVQRKQQPQQQEPKAGQEQAKPDDRNELARQGFRHGHDRQAGGRDDRKVDDAGGRRETRRDDHRRSRSRDRRSRSRSSSRSRSRRSDSRDRERERPRDRERERERDRRRDGGRRRRSRSSSWGRGRSSSGRNGWGRSRSRSRSRGRVGRRQQTPSSSGVDVRRSTRRSSRSPSGGSPAGRRRATKRQRSRSPSSSRSRSREPRHRRKQARISRRRSRDSSRSPSSVSSARGDGRQPLDTPRSPLDAQRSPSVSAQRATHGAAGAGGHRRPTDDSKANIPRPPRGGPTRSPPRLSTRPSKDAPSAGATAGGKATGTAAAPGAPPGPLRTRASGSDMDIEEEGDHISHSQPLPSSQAAPGTQWGNGSQQGSGRGWQDGNRAAAGRPHQTSLRGRSTRPQGSTPVFLNDLVGSGIEQLEWFKQPGQYLREPPQFEKPTDFGALLRARSQRDGAAGAAQAAGAAVLRPQGGGAGAGPERNGSRMSQRWDGSNNSGQDHSGSQISSGGLARPSPVATAAGSQQPRRGDAAVRGAQPSGSARTTVPAPGHRPDVKRGRSAAEPAGRSRARTPDGGLNRDGGREDVEAEEEWGGTPRNGGGTRTVRAGPSERPQIMTDPLDDLPLLTLNMMNFSSGLLLGSGLDAPAGPDPLTGGAAGTAGASQAAARMGRPYRRDVLAKLFEEAKELKAKGDKSIKATRSWCPLSLLRYLESSLMYLEAAYGHEQCPDRERGTNDAIMLLDTLTMVTTTKSGMLRLVEQQSSVLLKLKRAAVRALQQEANEAAAGAAGSDREAAVKRLSHAVQEAQGEAMALQAIWVLAQQLLAVALTKLLMLRRDALCTAADAVAATPAAGAADAGMPLAMAGGRAAAGATVTATATQGRASVHGSSSTGPVGVAAGVGGAAVGGAGRRTGSPPPADSASSTLDGVNSVTLTTWTSSLHTLSTCMRQFASVGQLWQAAAGGARAMYRDAATIAAGGNTTEAADASGAPPQTSEQATERAADAGDAANNLGRAGGVGGTDIEAGPTPGPVWARVAHVAAAQILSMGYEWGVWDMLGTIMVARQVLDTITHLPGVA